MPDPSQPLPAWSLSRTDAYGAALRSSWPLKDPREWAWHGSLGEGVRVCIVDSGIDRSHPAVKAIGRTMTVTDTGGELRVEPDDGGDAYGHGTACAGIVRSLAPGCEIDSVRVLGSDLAGRGAELLAGVRWAIEQRYHVINLSLSTTKRDVARELQPLTDAAYFQGTVITASAHNLAITSYPWRFSAVVSVGSHDGDDPLEFYCNPKPPAEFLARGANVTVAWLGGATTRVTGNSFATPHITGIVALILGKHPELSPSEVKSALRLTATNTRSAP